MAAFRSLVISVLSALCLLTFLYYTLFPQGPHLLLSLGGFASRDSASPTGAMSGEGDSSSETMFTAAKKFDPQVLLSAPRRSSALPNTEGDLAVYTVSTYSFASHQKTREIRVVDIASGQSRLITNDKEASSPRWLSGRELIWLKTTENSTKLITGHADAIDQVHVVATIPAPVSDFKLKELSGGKFAILLAAKALPDGELYSPGNQEKPRSSALLYDNLFVRHWDEYVTPFKNALWHGILEAPKSGLMARQGTYALGQLTNLLKETHLESPIAPFGGADDFDLSESGVVFVAKDPTSNEALNTKSNVYHVSIGNEATGQHYSPPRRIEFDGFDGASASPVYSSDGRKVSYLQMKENGYESDQNRLFIFDAASPDGVAQIILEHEDGSDWTRSPSSIKFGQDSTQLLLTAQDNGRVNLFTLEMSTGSAPSGPSKPRSLTTHGQISDVQMLGESRNEALISGTSFVDNSFFSVLDISRAKQPRLVSSVSRNGSFFNLQQGQVDEFWFDGAQDYRVHAWVIKPSDFDKTRRYPLAYVIHGGPQGSWAEGWSTRWNPMVFAEQGYVVVLPDPTGSTGYGQEFTDGIKGQWGGRPYQDLVNGFDYVRENLKYVDTDRAVALGASYGGYMMAWIQGQSLGKKFKALVCHDGSFNLAAQLSSDEQYFPNHDMGGPVTEDEHLWDKWSPHLHISNWTTPMLVIHNELDYRLPISEGLAMFNVLQERGIKSRFLTFPDENHWVLKEENSLVWHTVVLNWINSFVGLPRYADEAELGVVVQN